MTKDPEIYNLLKRFAEGNYTLHDLKLIREKIDDPSEKKSVEKALKHYWYNQIIPEEKQTEEVDFEATLNKIHHKINRNYDQPGGKKRRISRNQIISRTFDIYNKAAAILLIPLLSVTLLYVFSIQTGKEQSGTNKTLYSEITAPKGSRIKMGLPDGSQVWLNHGSKLKYPQSFGEDSRKVYLSGEAYFDVTENSDTPFIVNTSGINVRVTGTEFNVTAYSNENSIGISLEKGSVELYKEKDNNKKQKKIYSMNPGEHAAYYPDSHEMNIIKGKNEIYTAWREGKIIFRNEPLPNIAKKLERRYNVDIILKNKKLKEYTFTATFLDETLRQILKLLSKAVPLEYTIKSMEQNKNNTFTKEEVILELKNGQNN